MHYLLSSSSSPSLALTKETRIRDKNGDRERIEEYIGMERRREMGIVTMYLFDGGFFFSLAIVGPTG